MRTCNACHPVPNLVHLTMVSGSVHSIVDDGDFLFMPDYYFSVILLYIFIDSWHPYYSQLLTSLPHAAMNIGVQTYYQHTKLISFQYTVYAA